MQKGRSGWNRRGRWSFTVKKKLYPKQVRLLNTTIKNRPYQGMPGHVGDGDVILSLMAIVKLFDEHAKEIGGAGFFYGIKSKIMTLFTDSHRTAIEDFISITPEHMLHQSGIPEDDPGLTGAFVNYCRMMPTTYDTYETCGEKIRSCVKITFSEKTDKSYQDELLKMRRITKVSWL